MENKDDFNMERDPKEDETSRPSGPNPSNDNRTSSNMDAASDNLKKGFESAKSEFNKEFQTVKDDFKGDGFIKRLFSFDSMITPTIIKIIFAFGLIVSIFFSLYLIIDGIDSYYGSGFQVFIGFICLILLPISIKVYCELLIVFFKIYEVLKEINNKLK